MRRLCFTIDLDRDVNDALPGSLAAISLDRGEGNSPRFSSTAKGTELLVDLLDELGVKATFFAESRALQMSHVSGLLSGYEVGLHGLDHEDFTGAKTGVELDEGAMREIIERAISLMRDCIGRQPKGFRAPYMNMDDTLLSFLPEYGIRYDSSYYTYVNGHVNPYRLNNGMIEVPVPKGTDINGKTITSYLWPMHEGARSPDDFIDFARTMDDGVFVLSTHTWHIVESRNNGPMDDEQIRVNIANVRRILETLQDDGFEICSISDMLP